MNRTVYIIDIVLFTEQNEFVSKNGKKSRKKKGALHNSELVVYILTPHIKPYIFNSIDILIKTTHLYMKKKNLIILKTTYIFRKPYIFFFLTNWLILIRNIVYRHIYLTLQFLAWLIIYREKNKIYGVKKKLKKELYIFFGRYTLWGFKTKLKNLTIEILND